MCLFNLQSYYALLFYKKNGRKGIFCSCLYEYLKYINVYFLNKHLYILRYTLSVYLYNSRVNHIIQSKVFQNRYHFYLS